MSDETAPINTLSWKGSILVIVPWYVPGYKAGGPIKSVRNIVANLGEHYRFTILTGDRDFGEDASYDSVPLDRLVATQGASIVYSSRRFLSLLRHYREGARRANAIYLNSFFSPRFAIFPMFLRRLGLIPRRPTIVAPRGEFSSGALALKSFKKRVFLLVVRLLRLYDDVCWHAASPQEAEDIVRIMAANKDCVTIAPNIADAPLEYYRLPIGGNHDAFSIVFLSRISRKKNLQFFIETVSRCHTPINADIYGPIEDAHYWDECLQVIADAPKGVTITYRGALKPHEVREVLLDYDLFFLPTLGENFGHVILEAMQAGLPVLLSDRTPWRDLQQHNVGACLPLSEPEAFTHYIEKLQFTPVQERYQQRQSVLKYALERLNNRSSIDAHKAMFDAATSQGSIDK